MDAMEKAQMMEDCAANTTLLGTQQMLRYTRDACLEGSWRVTIAWNHGSMFIKELGFARQVQNKRILFQFVFLPFIFRQFGLRSELVLFFNLSADSFSPRHLSLLTIPCHNYPMLGGRGLFPEGGGGDNNYLTLPLITCIDPMQKWLPFNYYFVLIQISLTIKPRF